MERRINIIGAGLAGSECANYLANKGYKVYLYEQRPVKMTPAHETSLFGELVCSNSLKSKKLDNACGLLKEEMRLFNSLMMEASDHSLVPAGNALGVDRTLFAEYITNKIKSNPNITVINEEVSELKEGINIIATGPLTSEAMMKIISKLTSEDSLFFYDAAAPIVTKDSINMDIAYKKSRYDQGDDAYINCPFTKEQFDLFYNELIHAEKAKLHEFDKVFESCLPIEVIASRGEKTLRFGPLKPKGLEIGDYRPYAVVQLRQDNVTGTLYNLVGFQTNLTYKEQKRVFSLIPGLENAEFVRYGLMHRNSYIASPKFLNKDFSLREHEDVYIVGQLSGVEGYVESAMAGLICAVYLDLKLKGFEFESLPLTTMTSSIINYITTCSMKNYAPMNANYGIMLTNNKDKLSLGELSLEEIKEWKKKKNLN